MLPKPLGVSPWAEMVSFWSTAWNVPDMSWVLDEGLLRYLLVWLQNN